MNSLFRNASGCIDTTAGIALTRIFCDEEKAREQALLEWMKTRPRVYVVSQFRGDTEENVQNAIRYCRHAIALGKMPVASHLLYPQILDDSSSFERKLGLQFGLSLLASCDEVWIFNHNREMSEGMRAELREARRLGKKVRFIDTEELQ